jgi:chemotaxis protein histidine kinase CheA
VAAPKRAGLWRYLKEAFAFRWNLLLFGGAAAAAAISGHADIALPLVAAAEVVYLAGLTTVPKFQAAIDAKAHKETRQIEAPQQTGAARDRILDVLRSLSDERRARFLRLRARCVEMTRIANAVRGETSDSSGASNTLRMPALDRLLWVFLRLLLSEQALQRFIDTAHEATITRTLEDLRARRKKRADSVAEGSQADDKILRSLDDSISTAEVRKENLDKARHNAEYIAAELDRLENKIQAVTELAVGNTDPDEMSSRIDAISEGISQTEQTIQSLQQITGVSDAEAAPSILATDLTPARITEGS